MTIAVMSTVNILLMQRRRIRTIDVMASLFAFANAVYRIELMTLRVHALDFFSAVTAVINLHPDFTIVAIEIELAFLIATIAFATAVHLLIVSITFSMNSVMTVALRFSKPASNRRRV